MSTLSWNYRGLGNPRSVQELVDLVSTKKPKLVFLMEIKVGRLQVDRVRNKLQYEGSFVVDSVRGGGGLVLLWKEMSWVKLISFSRNHIDVVVKIPDMREWRLTGFYGFPERSRRRESWELLKNLSRRSDLPWCCIGDFNDLLTQSEKRGQLMHPYYLIQGFREAVEFCGLRDMGMEGYPFTWEKSRGAFNWIEERLDRAMSTQRWSTLFDTACVYNLETISFDHSALLLDFLEKKVSRRRRFHFENAWIKEEDYRHLVGVSWSHGGRSIAECGHDLRVWGEEKRLLFKNKIKECKRRMKELKFKRDGVSLQRFKEVSSEYSSILDQQEDY